VVSLADTLTNFVQRQHEMKVTAMVSTGLTPGSKDKSLEVAKGRRESTVTLEILNSDSQHPTASAPAA
jgi:hypothetical protein